jgi:4-hydroxyproline epimerase
MGKISIGRHRIETPVGVVVVELLDDYTASVENVASYRYREAVAVDVPSLGMVTGDIAWGGNWFFLVGDAPYPLEMAYVNELTQVAGKIRDSLKEQGITGKEGGEIDHIEFFGPPKSKSAHSRNFVYCPGGAYDRSPCGTGTSAKVACLAASGNLKPAEDWLQESIIGSTFLARYRNGPTGQILPSIQGRAFVCNEGTLVCHEDDPYKNGIT